MNKGYPENKEIIFGYAGILGTVVTVLYTLYSGFMVGRNPGFEVTILALCLLNIFLVITSVSLMRRFFRLEQQVRPDKEKISQLEQSQIGVAKILHNINHQARNLISKINSDIITNDFSKERARDLAFQKYLIYLLGNIKEIFDLLTADQCAVCVKIIISNEQPELSTVKTQYRDSISFRERKSTDKNLQSFPYYENTAFKLIIQDPYKNPFFLSNDLRNEKGYNNKNPNWNKYYNASLVVPISIPLSKDQDRIILGFICIDNQKGGFDDVVCRNILSSIADLNFLVYKGLEEYYKKIYNNDNSRKN